MKKYSDGWTVVIFILALVFLVIDCANLGSTLLAWVFYRLGYGDGAKDGRRSVFTK